MSLNLPDTSYARKQLDAIVALACNEIKNITVKMQMQREEWVDEDELPICPGCGKPWHFANDECKHNPWRES